MEISLTRGEVNRAVFYWVNTAEEDFKTAKTLFDNKRYHHCLFFCHLFLEKIIKALIIKKKKRHALPIHNLLKLAKDAEINLAQEQKSKLAVINEFNIRARYNDYKQQFYKKATEEYTRDWFEKCKEMYQWLRKELAKK